MKNATLNKNVKSIMSQNIFRVVSLFRITYNLQGWVVSIMCFLLVSLLQWLSGHPYSRLFLHFDRVLKCKEAKREKINCKITFLSTPHPPLEICPSPKCSECLSVWQKKCLNSFGLGSTPPLNIFSKLKQRKSSSTNLVSVLTPLPLLVNAQIWADFFLQWLP